MHLLLTKIEIDYNKVEVFFNGVGYKYIFRVVLVIYHLRAQPEGSGDEPQPYNNLYVNHLVLCMHEACCTV